eukprot:CAMPEP_0170219616 /NCGR_PEP_ID=MMETSP0116_2-20130129/9495_1 /TAXON_ID=400756 /ORGANISM="Durinskia baltica, Strain CSIRO CS-38" /LENGTH=144 /DNA_ID=CAMNT_0010470293 /DNA_START=25 /DNA_END=459 /DNA_ORIENTATION=-
MNETMSSMGTNGDELALDPKDPDSLSKSKARRVRRKRLKERNTNCNENPLDHVVADDNCAGNKPKVVVQEAFEPPTPTDPAVVAVLVSDEKNEIVEQVRQTTSVEDVDCTIAGLEIPSHAQNKCQPTPVKDVEHTFVESTFDAP